MSCVAAYDWCFDGKGRVFVPSLFLNTKAVCVHYYSVFMCAECKRFIVLLGTLMMNAIY